MKDTNSLNKPVKSYKPVVTTPKGKVESDSAPNYRTLSMTPKRNVEKVIAGQAQYGQPTKEKPSTRPNKGPPPKVSNRPALSRKKGHTEPIPHKLEPLALPKYKPTSSKVPKSSTSSASTRPQEKTPLKNRFDFPLTQRELNQIRLSQMKGSEQTKTQELLNRLLAQSNKLAQQLTPQQQQQQQQQPQQVAQAPTPTIVKKEFQIKEQLTAELVAALDDAQYLEQTYPKQSQPEQQAGLTELRQRYGAGKKANAVHIQKIIRDKLVEIRNQLQTN